MGGIMQLVSTGYQDVFLTGDPTRSLWKRIMARKTNFAIESIETVFDVLYGSTSFINVKKAGDLLKSCVLEISMKRTSTESFYPAEQFIKSLTLLIGDQEVEKIQDFPTWSRVHDELFNDTEMRSANYRMMNFRPDDPPGAIRTFYLDLPLFFTRYLSNSLPLVALQYHEVKLKIEFEPPYNIPGIDSTYMPQVRFYGDYVFLDKPERVYFAQTEHEYIIEQLQTFVTIPNMSNSVNTTMVDLPFTLPSRYIIWVYKTNLHGQYTTSNSTFVTNEGYAPLQSAVIKCNGTDRFSERPGGYFNMVQTTQALGQAPSCGIYMYSFGVNADKQDPEGTLNFSKLDMVTLSYTNKAATAADISQVFDLSTTLENGITKFKNITIFSKNFNVLRIVEGQGGVLFSN